MRKLNTFLPFAQLYFALAIVFGTWVIYIPTITEKLQMSEGQLGFALFCAAIGALISTPLGRLTSNKLGVGKTAFFSLLLEAIVALGLFVAPHFYLLCVALLFFGVSMGFIQVSINLLVTEVEEERGIVIMSKCHGFFSLGALVASSLGTLLLIFLNNPLLHIIIASSISIGLQLIYKKQYYQITSTVKSSEQKKGKSAVKSLLLWALAIVGLSAMVSEGAIADWSGLYLKEVANINADFLGLGYAGFSLSMTIGRFIGDFFSKRFGSMQIVIIGLIFSLFGFAIVLTIHTFISIVGFIIIGAGFSIIVPEVYRLSTKIEGVDPSGGIAFIAGASYIGFLTGPVALGLIAEHFNLISSFAVIAGLISIATIISLTIRLKIKSRVSVNLQ